MIVLDASAWVSYSLRADSSHAVTRRWLSRYFDDGGEIIAPILLARRSAGAVARVTKRPELGGEASQRLYDLPNVQLLGSTRSWPSPRVLWRRDSCFAAAMQHTLQRQRSSIPAW